MYDGQDILVTEMNNQGEGKEESGRLTYGCAEEEVKVGWPRFYIRLHVFSRLTPCLTPCALLDIATH